MQHVISSSQLYEAGAVMFFHFPDEETNTQFEFFSKVTKEKLLELGWNC